MDNIEVTQPSLRYSEPMLLMRNERGNFRNVSAQADMSFSVQWLLAEPPSAT